MTKRQKASMLRLRVAFALLLIVALATVWWSTLPMVS